MTLSEPAQPVSDDLEHDTTMCMQFTSQKTTKICGRVREVIRLVATLVQGHIDALIMDSRDYSDRSAGEFGTQLIETASRYAFLRTLCVIGRYWGVMGCLLGNV